MLYENVKCIPYLVQLLNESAERKALHLCVNRILVKDGKSGYMSPEHAMESLFSVKSDVLDFWSNDARYHKWQEKHWFLSS